MTLRRGDLLPLHGSAGGLQLKMRNPRGDLVVRSQEFFRQQGPQDSREPLDRALQLDPALDGFRLLAPGP